MGIVLPVDPAIEILVSKATRPPSHGCQYGHVEIWGGTHCSSVGHNLILAHARAAKLYDQKYRSKQGGHISITLNGDWVEPYDGTEQSECHLDSNAASRSRSDLHAADRKMAAAVGWFADPIFLGKESYLMRELLGDRLPTFTPEEMLLVKDSSDFYGCNTCMSRSLG
jgi:beta-glucosidase